MGVQLRLSYERKNRLRVSENKVLKGIPGPKREEVVGFWRRLHNEELRNLHTSSYTIRVIISWRMRWVGHVARK
jgi:hypothetical protein